MIDISLNLDTIVLMLCSIAFVFIAFKWHLDSKHNFNIQSAFTNEKGYLSLSKLGQMVALATSTWVIIYQTRHSNLTEWLFTGYMLAWTGANAFNKYFESKTKNTSSSYQEDYELRNERAYREQP